MGRNGFTCPESLHVAQVLCGQSQASAPRGCGPACVYTEFWVPHLQHVQLAGAASVKGSLREPEARWMLIPGIRFVGDDIARPLESMIGRSGWKVGAMGVFGTVAERPALGRSLVGDFRILTNVDLW